LFNNIVGIYILEYYYDDARTHKR